MENTNGMCSDASYFTFHLGDIEDDKLSKVAFKAEQFHLIYILQRSTNTASTGKYTPSYTLSD